jgi:hypothetical protein
MHRNKDVNKRGPSHNFEVGMRVVVNEKASCGYGQRIGTVVENVFDSRYGIGFDDLTEPIVYLDCECLDLAPRTRAPHARR